MEPIVVAPTAADPVAEKKAPAIADPDGDGILGENNATAEGPQQIRQQLCRMTSRIPIGLVKAKRLQMISLV